ncbi:MAG: response regulator [Candidatus Sulfotelmatobacter sp.]
MTAHPHISQGMDEKINILMVDDQPGKLLTYEVMLSELGENLIKAHSGMEALEHLLKTDIALVLMDVSMPGMDGFETAQMIHQHPRFQNTPIVFVSGIHVTDMDRLKGYQQGAVDYVSVPVVPELLRAKVKVFAELHRKTKQLETLNAQMTVLQDEERRRIARELHDSVGQLLAAISMNSVLVEEESHKLSSTAAKRLSENAAMIAEASKQIRTISHLLHPPLLDEAGLASALQWYVEGFSERSKIEAKLDMPKEVAGLSKDMELSIFRVVQECLTNIHRHAGSPTVGIRIVQDEACLRVEIEDAGKGIPVEKQSMFVSSARGGVGLRGMRERLRQLGGTLQIQSNGHGTRVIAVLPVVRPAAAPAPREAEQQIAVTRKNLHNSPLLGSVEQSLGSV